MLRMSTISTAMNWRISLCTHAVRIGCLILILLLWTATPATAQTLVITNGVQIYSALTNTTVTMSNQCELRITGATTPITGCLIHLNSTDSFFVMLNIKPSVVVSSYLSQLRINGAAAVADVNCRVVQ